MPADGLLEEYVTAMLLRYIALDDAFIVMAIVSVAEPVNSYSVDVDDRVILVLDLYWKSVVPTFTAKVALPAADAFTLTEVIVPSIPSVEIVHVLAGLFPDPICKPLLPT